MLNENDELNFLGYVYHVHEHDCTGQTADGHTCTLGWSDFELFSQIVTALRQKLCIHANNKILKGF